MKDDPDDEPPYCGTCSGTGMPQFGPPDRGCCSACNGSGYHQGSRYERDEPDEPHYDEEG